MTDNFKLLSDAEHIRKRFSMYGGSQVVQEEVSFINTEFKKVNIVGGLLKVFSGAGTLGLLFFSSIEIAKIVATSAIHTYGKKIGFIYNVLLSLGIGIAMLITSIGIYGFLSSAYQSTATKSEIVDKQIAALETKKQLYIDSRDNILKEKQSLSELRGTLSKGSTTQFTDRKGNLVVRTNNAAIRNIESASKSDEKLSEKVDVVNDSIFSLENQILEVKTNSEATSELGPLKYISKLTGQPMDKIINWFLLVIIFVFDPLAIALVIAANFAFAQIRPKKEYPLEEQVEDMRKVVTTYDALNELAKVQEEAGLYDNEGSDIYTEDELKDWDSTLMDGLENEPTVTMSKLDMNLFAFVAWLVRNQHAHSEDRLTINDGYEWYNYMWNKWLQNSDIGKKISNGDTTVIGINNIPDTNTDENITTDKNTNHPRWTSTTTWDNLDANNNQSTTKIANPYEDDSVYIDELMLSIYVDMGCLVARI